MKKVVLTVGIAVLLLAVTAMAAQTERVTISISVSGTLSIALSNAAVTPSMDYNQTNIVLIGPVTNDGSCIGTLQIRSTNGTSLYWTNAKSGATDTPPSINHYRLYALFGANGDPTPLTGDFQEDGDDGVSTSYNDCTTDNYTDIVGSLVMSDNGVAVAPNDVLRLWVKVLTPTAGACGVTESIPLDIEIH